MRGMGVWQDILQFKKNKNKKLYFPFKLQKNLNIPISTTCNVYLDKNKWKSAAEKERMEKFL